MESTATVSNEAARRPPESPRRRPRQVPADGDLQGLRDTVTNFIGEAEGFARDQLAQRPYTTLLAGAGFGYVVSSAVPRWIGRWAIALSTRLAFEVIAREVVSLVGNEISPSVRAARPESVP